MHSTRTHKQARTHTHMQAAHCRHVTKGDKYRKRRKLNNNCARTQNFTQFSSVRQQRRSESADRQTSLDKNKLATMAASTMTATATELAAAAAETYDRASRCDQLQKLSKSCKRIYIATPSKWWVY